MEPGTARLVAQHKDADGRFFADRVRVKRTPIVRDIEAVGCGLTMGWTVAEAASEETAQAIAEALNVKFAAEIAATRALIDRAIAMTEATA